MGLPDDNSPIDGAADRLPLLEKLRRGARGAGPNRGSERVTTSRAVGGPEPPGGSTSHGQHRMAGTSEEPVLLDPSARELITRGGFRGPRGRHVDGYPGVTEEIAAGLPPVLAPWKPVDMLPKDARIPAIPHQMTRYIDITTTANSGRLLDRDCGHPIRTLQLDNYSRIWLYIPAAGRYVPPYTFGIQFPIFDAASKMEVIASAPPVFTQPAVNTSETFSITASEAVHEYSPGISVGSISGSSPSAGAVLITGTHTPSDAYPNNSDALDTINYNMVFNGTTWDRFIEPNTGTYGPTGLPAVAASMRGAGGTWISLSGAGAINSDNSAGNTAYLAVMAPYCFNGTNYDRVRGSNTGATGALATTAAAPTAANMLDGFANVQATTTTTLVTVPASRTWIGYVGVSAATSVAAGGAASTVSSTITTANGTGVATPAAGTYMRVDANVAAVPAAVSPAQNDASATGQRLIVQASAGGTALIQHVATIAGGTNPQASGWAIGELM